MVGIYKIENIINHKVYIGQSSNIESRWNQHIHDLTKNIHRNSHLQNSWNKYGENNFAFSVIEECEENLLDERENYWINYYGGCNSCKTYNNREAGNNGRHSDETREKLRQINLGKPAWNKGLTAETDIRLMKASMKLRGNHLTDEQRKQISETVKLRHKEGVYNYEEANKKKIETRKLNGTVRKDKGIKRGKRPDSVGKAISLGKLNANKRKRELGLPLRNQEKKPIPMKVSVCTICGKEFTQRKCHYKKTCSKECRFKQIAITYKENKKNECKVISGKI